MRSTLRLLAVLCGVVALGFASATPARAATIYWGDNHPGGDLNVYLSWLGLDSGSVSVSGGCSGMTGDSNGAAVCSEFNPAGMILTADFTTGTGNNYGAGFGINLWSQDSTFDDGPYNSNVLSGTLSDTLLVQGTYDGVLQHLVLTFRSDEGGNLGPAFDASNTGEFGWANFLEQEGGNLFTGGDVTGIDGLDIIVDSDIPEPASMLLLGSGLLGLAAVVRRRKAVASKTIA